MPFAKLPVMLLSPSENRSATCKHCGASAPVDAAFAPFCCWGCKAVYALIRDQGLQKYYDLSQGQLSPVGQLPTNRSDGWITELVGKNDPSSKVFFATVDVQGIHCAGCVWLLNELFRRENGGIQITVNSTLGQASLWWNGCEFDLVSYIRNVERFGYQFGPSRKTENASPWNHWLVRLGIVSAISINVMLFSVSYYFGLSRADAEIFNLFTWLSLGLSTVSVLVGGWPFFQRAFHGLRSGILQLDLPIALGIALVYGISCVQMATDGKNLYLDTLNIFIALMLLGRWLQQHTLTKNRNFLLKDSGVEQWNVRRIRNGQLETLDASKIEIGDQLLVAPGEWVAVDAALIDEQARFNTDWINGEADVLHLEKGGRIPAGAANASNKAIHVNALGTVENSPLIQMLRNPPQPLDEVSPIGFYHRLSKSWVLKVLFVSAAGAVFWTWFEGWQKGVEVAAGLLVITCPCAIGLAIPLAYQLVLTHIRRNGFFVRRVDVLDRLVNVKKVLFDKTGTLTMGRLELDGIDAIGSSSPIPDDALEIAFNLAARSNHPVSLSIARSLANRCIYRPEWSSHEVSGQGIECSVSGKFWRMGRSAWAGGESEMGTVLSCDGTPIAKFRLREVLRPDTAAEIKAMESLGLTVWLISGDKKDRVEQLAARVGIARDHLYWEQTPEQKSALVAQLDSNDTLYLGDGVNDALAFSKAYCAGTPAIDRPVMPGRSDFFLTGEGLHGLTTAIKRARELRAMVRRLLAVSLTYNAVAITLGLLGYITPLIAAVAMPASTLSLLALTIGGLRKQPTASNSSPINANPKTKEAYA